jgi:hypothetical protein
MKLHNIEWRAALAKGMIITLKEWGNSGNRSYVANGTHLINWSGQDAIEAHRALDLAVNASNSAGVN